MGLQPTATTNPSTMKSVIALCLFGLALGAPRPQEEAIDLPDEVVQEVVEEAPIEIAPVQLIQQALAPLSPFPSFAPLETHFRDYAEGESVSVLHDERSPVIGAVFNNELQLDNGISERRSGSVGAAGTAVMRGTYTIPLGNGEWATFNWVADEYGYRVESPFLPTV